MIPSLQESPLLSAVLSIASIWIFTLINTRSIRSVGKVQLVTTIIKLLPLLILGTIGFMHFNPENFRPLNASNLSDFDAVTATAVLTLWAFLGLESATIPSDKVLNPKKTIPRATIAGILVAALLFVSSNTAIIGIVDPVQLQSSPAPFADAAQIAWGSWAAKLIALAAVISCLGALNGWILIQGQLPMAAAKDGVFPPGFKRTTKNGIPLIGIIIASTLASVLVFMNYTKGLVEMFKFIIMLSTLTCLLPYLFSSLSELMIYLRKKRPYSKKKLIAASLISIPAFLYSLWAITGIGLEVIAWGAVLLATGIPIYYISTRKTRGR